MTTEPAPSRIPLGLQAVFLASNRGKDVNKPPPEKAASKTFTRNWMFQGIGRATRSRRTKGQRSKQERGLNKISQFGRNLRGSTNTASTTGSDGSHTSVGSMNDEPVAQIRSKTIETFVQKPPAKPKVCSS